MRCSRICRYMKGLMRCRLSRYMWGINDMYAVWVYIGINEM